jgi:hypothetical protein
MKKPKTNPNSAPIMVQVNEHFSSCKKDAIDGIPTINHPNGAISKVKTPNNKNLLFFKFMSFLG